jgi:acetyltransferase-like isoleucine patch superfamily enzyme
MRLLWRLLDPWLIVLRNRLGHLDRHNPSGAYEAELRRIATVAPSAKVFRTTAFDLASPVNLTIGEHTVVHGLVRTATPAARVTIGHFSYVGPGTTILAERSISIGDYVYIANNVDILDSDSHSFDWRERRAEAESRATREPYPRDGIASAPVAIEDDVWIGAKATVLSGVRIGRGAIVAAGAVVVKDVPPFTLVAGVPARVIRELPR